MLDSGHWSPSMHFSIIPAVGQPVPTVQPEGPPADMSAVQIPEFPALGIKHNASDVSDLDHHRMVQLGPAQIDRRQPPAS
jgi:hypothetical protein